MVPPPSTQPPQATDDLTPAHSNTGAPAAASDAPAATLDYTGGGDSAAPVADLAADLAAAFGDRFTVEQALGRGGFGAVYEATDGRLNRRVAIKATRARTADPEKLLREARALAQLRHPGIVAVYDVAVAGTHCFVVSELLPGPSLAEWARASPPAPAEAARVSAEVADALAHAHARSIVHRDLKPSNVVFADGRRPVLVDFGLALSDQDAGAERGVVSGTPAYMSPEQAAGRAHRPDGRTDVYGLAATLYALLCGRAPFRGANTADILRQVREDDPPPPRQLRPDVPPALEAACLKGLAKLPGDRFTTAADFADALRRAVGLLPPLDAPAPATPAAPAAPAVPRGPRAERRQVTLVQFGFDPVAGEDDDPTEQVAAFQAACAAAVADHGGLTLQAGGTTLVACFGFPTAHEDAPRQAVRAALAACAALPAAGAAVGSGTAVVTEAPGTAPTVVGEVTAAVAAVAALGAAGVTITDGTHRLAGGFLDAEPAGEVKPRGAAAGVALFRVTGERAARSRVEAADPARLTPLVGRDREVDLLRERWALAAEGVRNVILLVADPGLGKSRLVRTLKDHALDRAAGADSVRSGSAQTGPAAVVEWYCSPYHQGSPFYPVTDYFDRAYQLAREPDPARRLDALVARLRADGVHDPDDLALFAAMLSVPAGDRLPALALSPERQKERTLDALLAWLGARAEAAPVLFVVEDLHWVDPSTEALLARFVEAGGEARVLGVFTFRPEYDPPWKGKAVQTQVALNRLTRAQVGELIRAQAGADVPAAVVDQIADRTDGVPLFVEEFTRLVADGGKAGLDTAIPATLQDLLLARLDRMASDREVVQLGATIGRTFGYDLIRAATDRDEAVLRGELRKLVDAGLLFPKGTVPRATYTFKHALIQDAAYQSLVKKTRQQLHRRVADALAKSFPAVVETQPELLAHHVAEAGDAAGSVPHWLAAGERARGRSAHAEAIRHLARGMSLAAAAPAGAARDATELGFRMPLAASNLALRGYASREVEDHIGRARELCLALGPTAPLFQVMMITWALRLIQGRNELSGELSRELLALAADRDASYRTEADWTGTCTAFWAGRFGDSYDYAVRGAATWEPGPSAAHAKLTQQNSGPLISAYAGKAAWALGRPAEAAEWFRKAVALAEGLSHPYTLTVTLWKPGFAAQLGCDGRATLHWAERVLEVSETQSFAFWVGLGRSMKGAALGLLGRPAEAIPLLEDGLRTVESTGCEMVHQNNLGCLADALWRVGRRDDAWAALGRALTLTARDGERYVEAELYRRKAGFLLAAGGDRAEAVALLERAMATARAQGAKFFELRAAVDLARAWAADGRDGRGLVGGLAAAFPGGAAAPDLDAARAFLAGDTQPEAAG